MVNSFGCKGPCDQGRKNCPHPQACELDDEPEYGPREWFDSTLFDALCVVAVITCVLAVAAAAYWAGSQ
ncbi:MAG: hypothetical protein RJA99_3223 [Pseudomonadota bacterium]|jgi:hypothetical protein